MVAPKALPRKAATLTAAVQPLQQQSADCPFKAVECLTIVSDPKVIEMSPQLSPECLPEFWQLVRVPFLAQPLIDRRGLSSNGTGSYAKAESLAERAFQNPFF